MSGIFDQVINYTPNSLITGGVIYKGTWSAASNTPTLTSPTDSTTLGSYYVVSEAGTRFSLDFNIGDWVISNGSAWEKVDNTDAVSSVFGRTGAVVGVSTDYSSVGITATAVGASSPSTGAFTTLSATTPLAATSGGTGLSSLGTGVATFLGTPTSANLAAAVTNETGSGSLVFGTSPTITTPVIAQINDASGNETLKLASIASAVNEVTIENAATGNAVHISATGGDASVGLHLVGKGASGYVNVQDSTDATKRIMFNASGGTTNTRTMLSSTQTVDRTLSLPDATDTLVGKATTDTLTNKTLTSPTLTAPILGTPASGNLASCTGYVGTSALVTVGALNSGSITSGFGSIDVGADAISGGVISGTNLTVSGGTFTPAAGTATLYAANTTAKRLVSYGPDNSTIGTLTIGAMSANASIGSNAIITIDGSGGNGVWGATTPSTGAFSTLSATGAITSTLTNGVTLTNTSHTTTNNLIALGNTGNTTYIGTEASAGGSTFGGSTAYATVIGTQTNVPTQIFSNNALVGSFSSTGLAVTGIISATAELSTTYATYNAIRATGSSSNAVGLALNNTYAGARHWVISSSGGGPSANGTLAFYDATGSALIAAMSTTGLAVTGTLSATNTITSSAPTGYRTLQATATLSVAPNAVQNLVTQNYGFYFISETSITGSIAIIASNASGPFIVWQQGTDYSITINTASKFNVYYSSGNQIVIQNKQSGTATFTVINLAGGS